ncbi:hypothetical protein GALMADRAFT_224011 [Galerina marginata CBS 339.88]|uniref:Uncharacterized protein n=1 Tax=Galerina marginata (strain CBS 339.88) TaxID=685588 RepID=A0A067TFS2_GALM3|nr:hypothetical protein GALMADRAFT_224011 [Galerina marginata CBS 339.88]
MISIDPNILVVLSPPGLHEDRVREYLFSSAENRDRRDSNGTWRRRDHDVKRHSTRQARSINAFPILTYLVLNAFYLRLPLDTYFEYFLATELSA